MPTYNGERFLPHALESLVEQRDRDIEVIAIDDGSTDATVEILHAFESRMPLRIIEQERRGNWVSGTNRGIREASGTHVSILHQDDLWLPDRARITRAALRRSPTTALLLHPVWYIDEAGRRRGRWRCPLRPRARLSGRSVVERLIVQNFIAIPGATFLRDLAIETGGMDEDLWYTADWDLWLRLAWLGEVTYLPEELAAFRIHPAAQTARGSAESPRFREQLELVLEAHLPKLGDRGPREVEAAARFSVEMNVALAAMSHGERAKLGKLVSGFLRLGPRGWGRYLRDSRIVERLRARLRAGLHRPSSPR